MGARERFVQVRSAVVELATVQALLSTMGDDWKPDDVKAPGLSDPTASRAIYNVDELGARLEELRRREDALLDFIGLALEIIEGVRKGLGEDYASLIEQRYVDCLAWRDCELDGERVSVSTGKRKLSIAFDWIDSLGVAYILRGEYEL